MVIASRVLDAHEDLGRALRAIVAVRAEHPALTFLPDGERIGVSWTYGELDFHARSMGRRIAETVGRGSRVLVAAPPGPAFLTAFLGAMYAGTVPVPIPVPRFQAQLERTALVAQDAQADAIVAPPQAVAALQCSIPLLDPGLTPDPGAWMPRPLYAEDLALLQYTSGSTGTPRGVMVSHRNLVANSALIARRFNYDRDCTGVTWLPPSHDMGLIEGLLQPLLNGAHCIVMPPDAFLRRPRRWLQAISTFGGTHSGAPDFAYALCTQRLSDEDCMGLDLSTWRIAYLGAEPIQPATVREFAARFAARGFSQQAFRACYGLAEATLLVSEGPLQTLTVDAEALAQDTVVSTSPEDPRARELVSCGFPDPSIAVRVLDVQTGSESESDRVGEICLAGPSIAQGYWRAPEATQRAFGESSTGQRWLRTGDLGFVAAGRLVITGRLKDLIILNGRNLYPQDVERAARNAHPAIRRMPVALGTYGQSAESRDRLVVLCEVSRLSLEELQAVTHAIRRSVSESIEVEPSAVVLLPPGSVRYTTSGKVMRGDLRARFLGAQLEILFAWHRPASDAGGDGVRELILSRLAGNYSEDDRLADLGADSLFTQELAHVLEIRHGVSVQSADLLRMTVARACQLARNIPPSIDADRQPSGGAVLTRAQQGLLFIHRLWGRRDPFVMSCPMQLPPSVEPGRLAAALAGLIGRHVILRTRFVEVGTEAGGWSIAETRPPVLEEYPHESLPDFLSQPFDLTSGPPLRLGLFVGSDSPRLLVLRAHHVALDFWSLRVLLRELAAFYTDRAASLPPPPDMGIAGRLEARDLASEQGASVHERWRTSLTDAPLYFELPLDRPRPRIPSFAGGRVSAYIEPQYTQRAQIAARNHGVSITTVLCAAFVALCGRYSGKRDVLLGMLVSGRTSSALSGHVGMTARLVPVRVMLSEELDSVALLQRTETALYEAQTLQPVALDLLLQGLRAPDRDLAAVPRILFNFLPTVEETEQALAALANNVPGKQLRLDGLELRSAALPPDAAFHDLILHVFRDDRGLRLVAHYATELFDPERMQRLLEHYSNLLEGLVCNPACALRDLPLMGQKELQQLLSDYCGADDRKAPDRTLHDLVGAQARRTPVAIALTAGDVSLSYEDLELAAGRMAACLRQEGVGPGDRVAIHLPRDVRLPVAMLAVLKTGAAYVPLDPAYPPQRLRMMLADSGARLVISDSKSVAFVQPLDTFAAHIARDGPVLEPQAVGSDWPAYVLFTSGSTGRPKGVVIAHRSAAALAAWAGAQFGPALRRVFASTSASFDLSVFEIFGTLAYGGTVILAPNLLALAEMGAQCRPTLLSGVPSVLAALHEQGSLPAVEALAVAGEPLSTELADRLLMTGTGTRVFDLYGPTEGTTYATGCERTFGAPASIGRPLPYTRLYLLDPALQPVPAGIPGEIFLGGDRLARGYVGQPAQTADRFLPDPFSSRPGAVMYRTGDLGCLRADGNLKYLGRIDRQIKLRGFRIELSEIERVIGAHPAVRDVAVVLVPGRGAASEQLVAWVVLNAPSLAGELRELTAARLPGFMLPSAFICVDELPQTPNGKLDRDELTRRGVQVAAQAGILEPADPRTVELAGLMGQVLGRVGLECDADFFMNGGHSLAVLELCRQIRLQLELDVPVRWVFEAPTPRLLAKRLGAATLPASPAQSCEPDFPQLNFAQRQLWYEYQAEPTSAAYNLAVLLRFSRPVRSDCVAGALRDIAATHPVLRSRLSTGAPPSWIALEQDAGDIPDADLLVLEREEPQFAAAAQVLAAQRFRLNHEAPWRACLLRSSPGRCALVLCAHHLAIDGISLNLLIRQLLQAMVAREDGLPAGADAAAPQPGARIVFEAGSRDVDREYWERVLANARPTQVPPDEPLAVVPRSAGGLYGFDIPPALHARIRELAGQRSVTPFMVVLTGLIALLARTVGQYDIVIGMAVSLRQPTQADDRIGMFVQPVLLRFRLRTQMSFQDLLNQVREVVLDALAHASLPFEQVLATAKPLRHSPAESFYSVLVSAQDVLEQHVELPGLAVDCHSVSTGAARADFTVLLQLGPEEARCGVEYRRSLYTEESVSAVSAAWMRLLTEGVLEPDTLVGVLPSVSPLEHAVQTRVAARAGFGTAWALHQRVLAHGVRVPGARAITYRETTRTYAELVARSRDWAATFAQSGAKPGDVVVLCLPDPFDTAAAMIGAMARRLVWVAADPSGPVHEVQRISESAGARWLAAPPDWTPHLLAPGRIGPPAAGADPGSANFLDDAHSASLACCVEMDRSGKPVLLAFDHAAVSAMAGQFQARLEGRAAGPVIAWCLSQRGEFGLLGLLIPLAMGAEVSVAAADGATHLHIDVPGVEELMIRNALPSSVRTVALPAGNIPPALSQHLVAADASSVSVSGVLLGSSLWTWLSVAPAGTKAGHPRECTARILDARGEPVPFYMTGDVYSCGAQLPGGYFGEPGLTARDFVPDPFGCNGSRLWFTGLRARSLPNGTMLTSTPREVIHPTAEGAAGLGAAVHSMTDGSISDIVADAWRELLGAAPAPGASFFEAGGNSLLAVRLLARLEAATGQPLALKDFVARSTLQGLVESIRRGRSSYGAPRLPALQVGLERGSAASPGCVLSAAQKQVLLFQQLSPDVAAYNVACAIRYIGTLSRNLLEQAFRTLVERHPALRTRVGAVDNRPVQVIEPKAEFALELIELAHLAGDRVAAARRAAEAFQARQFDLTRAPLIRAALISVSPGDHVLVITAHHIVSDAFSLELLLHELGVIYGGRTLEAPVAASPADFAVWEESWIRTPPALVAAAHWQDRLRGLTYAPVLPFRGGAGTGACTVTRQIGVQTRDQLRALAVRTGATLFHVLLTGYLWLLNRVSQRAELVIGLPVTTRRELSLERAVGFFSNTVPLRVDCAFALDAQSLVAHVRDAVVDAHEWGWLPLPQILEAWQPPRDPNRPHFFETLFVMHDGLPAGLFPDPVSRFQTDLGAARCELLLSIINEADGLCVQLQAAGGERVSAVAQFLGTALVRILEQLALGVLAADPVVLPMNAPEPAQDIDVDVDISLLSPPQGEANRLVWQRAQAPLQFRPEPRDVLVYADNEAVRQGLARSLRTRGIQCVLASPGRAFAQVEADRFVLRPALAEDYQRLWSALEKRPGLVIYAAEGMAGPGESLPAQQWQEQLLTPLCGLFQAFGQAPHVELVVMTRGAQLTAFDSRNDLGQAALGWLAVRLAERKSLRVVRTMDLGLQRHVNDEDAGVLEAITCGADHEVALRGSLRLVKRLVPLPALDSPLCMQGHWLVLGASAESLSSQLRQRPGLQVTALEGDLGRIDLDLLPQFISRAEQTLGALSGICCIDAASERQDADAGAYLVARLSLAERLAVVLNGRATACLSWLSLEPLVEAGPGAYTSTVDVVARCFRSDAGRGLASCFIRCQLEAGGSSDIESLRYLDRAGAWAYVAGVDLFIQGRRSMEKHQHETESLALSAVAPADSVESAVAAVWSELLDRESIPRDVPFFALGGSSVDLPAMKLRLDSLFKRDIPTHIFFSAPTVARLAQWLQCEPTGRSAVQVPEARRRLRWRSRTRTARPE